MGGLREYEIVMTITSACNSSVAYRHFDFSPNRMNTSVHRPDAITMGFTWYATGMCSGMPPRGIKASDMLLTW